MRLAAALAIALMACAAPAIAEPHSKLLDQIDLGLRSQGIVADLSHITLSEAAQLYLELSSPDDEPGQDVRSRGNLLNILRKNPKVVIHHQ